MSSRLTSLVSVAVLVALFVAADAWAKDDPKAPHAPAKPHATPAAKPTSKPKPADSAPSKEATATGGDASRAAASTHQVVEHESRIEFDERMVRGQTAAGAIYLFQRSPTEFKSIVQVPESFRPRTVEMLTSRRNVP